MYFRLKFLVFVALFAVITPTYSQQNSSDSLAQLYNHYLNLMKNSQSLSDSMTQLHSSVGNVNNNFSSVDAKLERITNDLSQSLQQVSKLTKNDLLTKESRLNTQKRKILMTSVFVKSANNSFDAIDAALAQSDYLGDVGGLNLPTNTDLGFSLSDEVTVLLKDKIIKGSKKVGNGTPEKIIAFVQEIIKDPIVTSVTNAVPALSSISAVVNLVSGLAISDKRVSVNDFMEFNKELEKYIVHYEALGRANYDFNSNVDKLKVKTDALREILTTYTIDRIKTIAPLAQLNKEAPLHQMISQYYDYQDLHKIIDEILAKHAKRGKINYQTALNEKRLDYPFYAFNQAQFIQQELETISSEYISTYIRYHENIKITLENSKALSKDPKKIDAKLASLEAKLETLIETFKRNVKIREVNKNLQRIPTL